MKHLNLVLLTVFTLAGCTATDEIIIDEKGIDMAAYQNDLSECRAYASQVKTQDKTVKGAASGAVVGGLLGAITGGAGIGAVGGGARGAEEGDRTEVDVVRRCISGRGYRLLN